MRFNTEILYKYLRFSNKIKHIDSGVIKITNNNNNELIIKLKRRLVLNINQIVSYYKMHIRF